MAIFLVSDLHLACPEDAATQLWLQFLARYGQGMQALYILGDFVEFWIGDDALPTHPLAAILSQTRDLACPVYFVVGNRDFLVGKRFADYIGATLLPEPTIVTVAEQRFLLLHGDSLCRADQKHQRFRKITRWRWLQWLFQRLPLAYRQKLGETLRATSRRRQTQTPSPYAPADHAYAAQMLTHFHCQQMIHGHLHTPAWHFFQPELHGFSGFRAVLSDWREQAVFAEISENGQLRLCQIALEKSL
jgi:UDP-2,3-diacylglucosamine hydrolase